MSTLHRCPSCAAEVPDSATVCPRCRGALTGDDVTRLDDRTRLSDGSDDDQTRPSNPRSEVTRPGTPPGGPPSGSRPAHSSRTPRSGGSPPSSGSIDHGRFPPGTILGERYRIVGRLGRGGMGEVYRADDLKLDQQVALKFLPPEVDRDPAKLTQLHTEVRMARQVSHPNVCRVYDIDEQDGHTFLSMEYVDGEDLAASLKRIGRFPEDRGLEIARQICAGLAAAHERGVVHRDFKPANVMLDGSGKVRITDFGLAGAAGDFIRSGTPAYMAPEQLSGGEVTARSDIYSLGLVLYELFTGQRALEGKTLAEVIHKREQSQIVAPRAIVESLDLKIEQIIQRCLRPERELRPASALAVAAALPGGDPLAAALAAGETPSPEAIAAAGSSDALRPAIGIVMLAAIVGGLLLYASMGDRHFLYSKVPMQKTLDGLEDRARDVVGQIGYSPRPRSSARGLAVNYEYLSHVYRSDQSKDRWDKLAASGAPVMLFWHRLSPSPLVPVSTQWSPTLNDPPPTQPGMTTTTLDDSGRLVEFAAVPPRMDPKDDAEVQAPSWPVLFEAAGLRMDKFRPVAPEWVPREFADRRQAWQGPFRDDASTNVRVEAASYRGRPVFFKLVGPWTATDRGAPQNAAANASQYWRLARDLIWVLLLAGVGLMARSNLLAGRGDRRGAVRIVLFTAPIWMAAWVLAARHHADFQTEQDLFFQYLGFVLVQVGILWLFYISIEPYVRRFSPHLLISWTRVLTGRIVDPRVGRDVLVGVLVGIAMALLGMLFNSAPELLGDAPSTPRAANINFLLGHDIAAGSLLRMIPNAMSNAMGIAVIFVIGSAVFRRRWAGAIAASAVLMIAIMGESGSSRMWVTALFAAAFAVPLISTLVFSGLLAEAVAFLVNQSLNNTPLTLNLSHPHASAGLWTILLVVSLAVFGFYTSGCGLPGLGRLLQADRK